MGSRKTGRVRAGVYQGVGYSGTIVKSRVAQDWVEHTVELFEPITVNGSKLSSIRVFDQHITDTHTGQT